MVVNDPNLSPSVSPPPSAEDSDRLLIDLHVARGAIERAMYALATMVMYPGEALLPEIELAQLELVQAEAAVTRAIGRRRAQL